jgi:DNA-binding MarR family transcriptional regulator
VGAGVTLTPRQRLILAEVLAEVATPVPGDGGVGPRWDGLVLDIRNRLAARHRAALASGMEKPGPMLSGEQVAQILTQLVDKGLLTVARGADYSRRVRVTEAGRAALPAEP